MSGRRPLPDLADLDGRSIAVDCRWLGLGGPGRVTSTLLAGLRQIAPPGHWILWGDAAALQPFAWPGAELRPADVHPKRAFGQASFRACPSADLVVFLHHWRPLFIRSRSVTLLHDTIPLRFARSGPRGWLQRRYFELAARRSSLVLTVSEWSRDRLVADTGVAPARVKVVRNALDPGLPDRVRQRRLANSGTTRTELVAVGRFAPHKNYPRLVAAFHRAGLAARGFTLRIAGGSDEEVADFSRRLARRGLAEGVRLDAYLPDDELANVLAGARALIAVSLEEGFGLPAFEAAAAGIPVLASPTGAMVEIPPSHAVFCDPKRVATVAAGLEAVLALPDPAPFRPAYESRDQATECCLALVEALRLPR
jgi:glycosyltransferase involved in cell wall biosynthesis